MKIAISRINKVELKTRCLRTYIFELLTTSALLNYIHFFDEKYAFSVYILIYTQLFTAVLLGLSVLVSRTVYRYRTAIKPLQSVPTVSVCIPARNETDDLPECIQSVIANTYPKLEIIVLDDCSHDKTPDIIKKFAHDGVRFVNGKEPRDDWLAKNAAYDRLADEANGDVLLFIGVDVRLQPDSIQQLVNQMNDNDMISVLPRRTLGSEVAVFIQPLRYWWEMGFWRFVSHRPPVLSSCWAIRADVLKKLGSFESVKKAVEPEAVFARKLDKSKKYAFLIANSTVGVVSVKAPQQQNQTALRKRYPQLRRRPENIAILVSAQALVVLAPYTMLVWFTLNSYDASSLLPVTATVLILSLSNTAVYKLSMRRLWPIGLLSLPALIVADWALMLRSMYAYEFDKVIWKERNICLALLSVEKSLPKL